MSSVNRTSQNSASTPTRPLGETPGKGTVSTAPLADPKLEADRLSLTAGLGHAAKPAGSHQGQAPHAEGHDPSHENLHGTMHGAHLKADVAKLAHSAPELAADLAKLAQKVPALSGETLSRLVELGEHSPTVTKALLRAIEHSPQLINSIAEAVPTITRALEKIGTTLAKEFPHLPKSTLLAAAEKSVLKHMGSVLPLAGLGIAAYGSYETAKALVDPNKSSQTKKAFLMANAVDWGAAIAGTGAIASGGLTEALSIGAAAVSMGLYARAELLSERDAELVKAGKPLPGSVPTPAPELDPMYLYGP